jgi:hypothetical protein
VSLCRGIGLVEQQEATASTTLTAPTACVARMTAGMAHSSMPKMMVTPLLLLLLLL